MMSAEPFPSNNAFLLACLTLGPDNVLEQFLQTPLDWDNFLQLAWDQGVAALVEMRLKTWQSHAVPDRIMQKLQRYVISQKIHNQTTTVEMNRISERFAAADIPYMVFKGPPLSVQLYGNIYSRSYADVDFLVHPDQTIAASRLLLEDGYRLVGGKLPAVIPRLGYHFAFIHPDHRRETELHWAVMPTHLPFPLSFEQLWKESVEVAVLDKFVHTPSLEDTLLILCMHGTKHGWVRLSWIYDIAAFLHTYPTLNWSDILQRAEQVHCRRMLLVALFLASDLLQADLPDPISEAIAADGHVRALAKEVQRWIFAPVDSHYFEKHAFQIKVRDHLSDKYRYVKLKQPFLDDNAIANISGVPQTDRTLFYLLWADRIVRKYAARPVLRAVMRTRGIGPKKS